ncbi:bifunctional cobalt-precorrin-7 (C(5))-methyltransferase/cobalt-precorrin-6B (C(15))-methyltransferase [Microvirga lotononidis]|uniref:Precorrin-6y C5,15-methyltransferase (Decarboxylating), CbiE subunit,precorrin-6Y C5,15-methyltransferase (Decarboxylating), CbiT subunit n=1 Tax=Microvirga lotononidis TaxID=864069 RepID=I4YWT4_9HYPH|nr:bifunctional cobalt-precorrin-7 (C(5))-methyltransferase/cobalt-precorrin-6B (C(15))-methyltransferase [Microvirga lotononidis]EIM28426.1 precorrin-6y C5,15-methyltransferase (decarboxylating), CbiE subunit,precorrin-6Y C5,15-methyltransferase (decarboxylating), CbiT subunit [Microvirga lotononidis]WQO27494.1 bifunctional cobalt-precorrin-7 (C(5))-methyltransferase/cobalt-precorrin-6B (C(15))-methyltransferase [Microvirga lotononidis]
MAPNSPWLTIIGIGEDGRAGLSPRALAALDQAAFVIGGTRHLELAEPLSGQAQPWPSPFADAYALILARRGEPTCVLATGDPFHYGVGAELARLIPAEEIACFPQPSAFSLAAARLGWSLPECDCVSLHGRALERIIPHLQPGGRILALSWDGSTPDKLAELLKARGFGASVITVCEALGGPRERIRRTNAADFSLLEIGPLNTVAIEVLAERDARIVTLAPGLPDAFFENDGQLTKAEIRALTLAALAPKAGELLWDIGLGAGSVGIEWCLRHPRNRCIGIEERPERAERARRNALDLGTATLDIRIGRAPDALVDLPAPDAIFIGGGASEAGVFDAAWAALKPGGRLVVNGVTLETETLLGNLYARHGGTMRRLAVSRLEPVGGMHGWRAAMPVMQWMVVKP